nr:YgaP-like transmembrane domain [Halobaculum saliterrae]
MKGNIGATDKQTRIVIGLGMAVVGLATLGGLLGLGMMVGAVVTLLGLVLVGTGLARVCLLYRLFGIDTSRSH